MRSLIIAIAFLCVAGCAHHHSIVGEWETHGETEHGKSVYHDDMTFHSEIESSIATLVLDGTYELKGEDLLIQVAHWDVPKGLKLKPVDRKAMDDAFASGSTATIGWLDDDHISLSGDGKLTTLTRITK